MGIETYKNLVNDFFRDNVQKVTFLDDPVELIDKITISFANTDGSINDSASALAKFDGFNQIVVSGSGEADNNDIFDINQAVVAAKLIVQGTLADEIAGASVSLKVPIPVIWQNDGFNVPINNREYIQFTIIPAPRFLRSFGNLNTYRTPGIAIANIFTPINFGTKLANELADIIATAFTAKSTGAVRFNTATQFPSAEDKGGAYYITPVHLPLQYDEQI